MPVRIANKIGNLLGFCSSVWHFNTWAVNSVAADSSAAFFFLSLDNMAVFVLMLIVNQYLIFDIYFLTGRGG